MTAETTFSAPSIVPHISVTTPGEKPFRGLSEGAWHEEKPGQGVPVNTVSGSTAKEMGMENGAGNYCLEVQQGERSAARKTVLQN